MNPQRRLSSSLSPRSIKTRFIIRFLRSLKKIRNQKCTRKSSYHKVKTAADSSMAYVMGPRRAWSRAMILKMKWKRNRSFRIRGPVMVVGGKKKMMIRKKKMKNNQISSQEAQLRKLIPGGELLDTFNLLDETADYIKCLNAQVIVMRSIVNYCST
ncbi:uncharacterized protein [Phyllobates terribilis]|uniref:uncharacterized protein n=1 Tax=Phyllobates terribilis TaxID=111132 RepID=UPI003CCB64CC